MIITWQGHSCFKIQDKVGPEGVTVVTDPFNKDLGLKVPNFEADIVTISHDHSDHNNASALRGQPFIISSAGEYDVKGVLIEGIDSYHDESQGEERGGNIIYRIEVDDISLVHLGDLGTELDDAQLSRLSGTDILMIPVGGKYTIDAKKAVAVISQIEPRIVIPMHYHDPSLPFELDSVDKFIKELGLAPTYEERLRITRKDLPQEDMELVILSK
ncbi:MAG: MBL fold metallo-hydrolase [Patescibacteria group bacterium]|jgi:L-ascorbate metabolism protein UlaG (beta-lactamase superfamily)